MNKLLELITSIISSHSGISSKRVCGIIGWIICMGVLIYCTIKRILAPVIMDTVLWCCIGLLGIDSVTGIWKKFDKPNK